RSPWPPRLPPAARGGWRASGRPGRRRRGSASSGRRRRSSPGRRGGPATGHTPGGRARCRGGAATWRKSSLRRVEKPGFCPTFGAWSMVSESTFYGSEPEMSDVPISLAGALLRRIPLRLLRPRPLRSPAPVFGRELAEEAGEVLLESFVARLPLLGQGDEL